MIFDLSLLILVTFILFTLVMFFCSLDKKVTSFREHAIGHRQFATAALIATIVACYCPGGMLKTSVIGASTGVYFIVDTMVIAFAPLLVLGWLAGRMSKFIYKLSMPETMGNVYGSYARLITALFEICNAVLIVSIQIRAIFDIVSLFVTSVSPFVITILITAVLVAYVVLGGVRAITFTDVWQCIISCTLIVILVWLIFKKTGKSAIEIIDFLQAQKEFELRNIMPPHGRVRNMFRLLSNLFIAIGPFLVQHVYMCHSPAQARKSLFYASIFVTAIIACMSLMGVLVFVCFPSVPSTNIWAHLLFNAPPFLKGMVCITMLSFMMSTLDSRLHIASIMFAYDIPKSIYFLRKFVHLRQLLVARVTLFALALLTMVLAFNCSTLEIVAILRWHARFYVPIIMAPFILAVLGFRTTPLAAVMGMVAGLLSVFAWRKWILPVLDTSCGHVPGMLINGLVMIITHYVLTTRSKGKHIKKIIGSFKPIQWARFVKNSMKDTIG